MQVKVGSRLRSSVCTTEVMVVKAPGDDIELTCGGAPMVASDAEPAGGSVDPAHAGGTQLGKRYAADDLGLELLVTKAGEGSLAVGGTELPIKGPKNLPSSD